MKLLLNRLRYKCVSTNRAEMILIYCGIVTICSVLLGIYYVKYIQNLSYSFEKYISDENKQAEINVKEQATEPVTNIAYLKAHKTASSSIQRILFRYGIKHDLHFAIPKEGNYFHYIKPFKRKMLDKNIIGNLKINIFAMHNAWDFNEIQAVMPKDTIYLASLREPLSQFESLYNFVPLRKYTNKSLSDYVRTVNSSEERVNHILGYNQMCYDFGVQTKDLSNIKNIEQMIKEADKLFHLVLIYERLNESLVLLKHLLRWDYDDVVLLSVNSREKKDRKQLSPETKELLRVRQHSDILLYNHFQEKFDKTVEEFGQDRMKEELKELENAKLKLISDCHIKQHLSKDVNNSKIQAIKKKVHVFLGNVGDPNCFPYIYNEVSLIDYVRQRQIRKVKEGINVAGKKSKK